MPRTSTTSVSVDGASPSSLFRAGSASHSSARISAYSADLVGKCLNSNPSEIEAAAATLLVVVPAKPLRAKQRFAALRINSRRKSLVMRSVLILVSKHSLGQMSRIFAAMQRATWAYPAKLIVGALFGVPADRVRSGAGPPQ